ncbi:three-Cys-motif partner protein TcmP [Kitasatospora sp. NPDC059327]|uniref:three-Cys-motif partner protein TcmP n=1 Tax=Kitasatospora sp. NPDC059327 TaxID=3346803 RepID=UPI00369681DC
MAGRKQELKNEPVWRSDPHTQVKHLVYRHYLQCWMGKILQTFKEATIVDAFAGPGVYKDGPPGSPIVVAKTFLEHSARGRFNRLNLICLEERPDRVEELRRQIDLLPRDPRLRITVAEPGRAVDRQAELSALAHQGDPDRPVLWLLDPFNLKSLPFELVKACTQGRRDEVLVSLFTGELHRFCEQPAFAPVMDAYFGGGAWQSAVGKSGQVTRKEAFADAYREALGEAGLLSGHFGIQVSRDSARYHLVLATHSEAGLACWNPVKWKLDAYTGKGASAHDIAQLGLFGEADVSSLESALRAHSGMEWSWSALTSEALRLGYKEAHLRTALDDLAQEGLAFRVQPVKANTRWPHDSVVRFYNEEDLEEDGFEDIEADSGQGRLV